MSDPITFDKLGTVTVTIDDETYTLGRPKLKHYRHFTRRYTEIQNGALARLAELNEAVDLAAAEIDKAKTAKAKAEAEAKHAPLADQAREFARSPFWEHFIEWTVEVFAELGDKPLPADSDDWPTWLAADQSLPGAILAHWRAAPKASGEPPPS
jgi:hypothetical protein